MPPENQVRDNARLANGPLCELYSSGVAVAGAIPWRPQFAEQIAQNGYTCD